MLKDKWEEKHGINLPAHATWSNGVQGTNAGNMITSGNGIEKIGSSSHKMASQPSHLGKNMLDEETHKPFSQIGNHADNSLVDANLKELIKVLSANYGPAPLEMGTPEYMKLVEILQQSSVQPNGFSDQPNDRGTSTTPSIEIASLAPSASTEQDKKKLPSEKVPHVVVEKLWDGSLQLSSSVTLSASAFFKSGEKLVGNNWPEFIEVKGKVRLDAFEKYVQDLPRSRNRGLMVTSICWNEESSNIGLNGMREVAKGYKKSSRVGFAHLLSGIDLYICPRSNPIITILAKYGFFKGMSVIDDKPDSMIGCVVWRKNRPLNTSDGKNSPDSIQAQNSPPGFSKQGSEKKYSPETSQHDELLTSPLTINSESQKNITAAEVDHNDVNSLSSSTSLQISVRKRSFDDDDLPEFDFGVARGKSTLVSKPLVNSQKLDSSISTQVPLEHSTKKTKLFDDDDDDDDMPEWRPPELHNQLTQQTTTSSFQKLLLYPQRPPLPPIPPPLRADSQSSFSYQPFRPGISSQPPTFLRPPPPPPRPPQQPTQQIPSSSLPMFNSNQVLWCHPGSFNVNPQFPPSNRRRF